MDDSDFDTDQLLRQASCGDTSATQLLFARHRAQLKRMVVIAAAGAYTIAGADDEMAIEIATASTMSSTSPTGDCPFSIRRM